MRSCPACGTANGETDDFCGNCGSYLGWSDQTPATPPAPRPAPEPGAPPAPAPAPEPAPEPAPAPAPPPAAEPPPSQRTAPSRRTAFSRRTSPSRRPAPEEPAAQPPTPEATAPPTPPPAATPAPATSAPPPDAVPDPDATPIAPVRPARAVTQRPVVRPVSQEPAPEGPPCPVCGTPNKPDRRFCRRCAAPLTATAPVARLPWWRTMWPLRRKVRIGSGRLLRRLLTLFVVLGLVLAGFLLLPAGRYVFQDVRDKLGGTAEISPQRVTASAAAPGHPASAATDSLSNKYWAAPRLGTSLTCTFDAPFRLVAVVVHSGASTTSEEFHRHPRLTRADLLVTTSDRKVHEKKLTLNDKPGPQTLQTGISDVVSVRLVVRAAAGSAEGGPIAVGEVEFFKRT